MCGLALFPFELKKLFECYSCDCVMWDYCANRQCFQVGLPWGVLLSFQDIIQNSDMSLDSMFQFSLAMDITAVSTTHTWSYMYSVVVGRSSVASALCWWSNQSSYRGFDSRSRQDENRFSAFSSQHLCRLASACLAFVCTTWTKSVAHGKDPIFTIQ